MAIIFNWIRKEFRPMSTIDDHAAYCLYAECADKLDAQQCSELIYCLDLLQNKVASLGRLQAIDAVALFRSAVIRQESELRSGKKSETI